MKIQLIRKLGKLQPGVYDWPEVTANKLVKLGFARKIEKAVYENKVLKTETTISPELMAASESVAAWTPVIEIVETGRGWYDVIVNGKTVNNKKLRKTEAEELVKSV